MDSLTNSAPAPSWYFAIGSMMNPVSLGARGIHPIESKSAQLLDHRIVFRGPNGAAGVEEGAGESFHGVLHLCTEEHMKILDEIEASYDRVVATAQCYDGTLESCTVYKFDESKLASMTGGEDSPPTERYLDIMIEGCKNFGVAPEYIEWLAQHEKQKRTAVQDFTPLPDAPAGITMTREELKLHTGSDGARLCFSCNGKVLEMLPECPLYNTSKAMVGGKDLTFILSKMKYDPKYGVPENEEQMGEEHKASITDEYMRSLAKIKEPGVNVNVVATLV